MSPTSNGCDLICDALEQLSSQRIKIVRIGTSTNRPDLDKKYGIHIKPTEKDAQIRIQDILEKAKIVVSASFSLHSNSLERSQHVYDTVIIDDASMVSEADVVTSLKHGCTRAIMVGNPALV